MNNYTILFILLLYSNIRGNCELKVFLEQFPGSDSNANQNIDALTLYCEVLYLFLGLLHLSSHFIAITSVTIYLSLSLHTPREYIYIYMLIYVYIRFF